MNDKAVCGPQGLTEAQIKQMVADADTGGRTPTGLTAKLLVAVALLWSLFQLWLASPLPFALGFGVFNHTEARSLHLAFAVFMAFLAYPAFKKSPRNKVPLADWVLAMVATFCVSYIYLFSHALALRPGLPSTLDIAVAVTGIFLLLEVARRTLGLPIVILAICFMAYIFFGPYMPDVIAHSGASLQRAMSHLWLTTEGVFGVAVGVSVGFIFLFVLFGALLETAGAGNYFIKSAMALLGHMKGGPAKAAVVASASTGLISGSSIANVATTGTFTIPLMKSVGMRSDKAAAVEVSSSVNGQLMPPVMGAAAFLMVEYVGISYVQVMKHAILPAVISYIALFYIVHIEAMKLNLQGLPRREPLPWQRAAVSMLMTVSGFIILSAMVYWGLGWIKDLAGERATLIVGVLVLATYIGIIRYVSRFPALEKVKPGETIDYLPEIGPTLKSGLHYLLPVVVLVWNLMVEQLSPALSAFWAIVALIFILLTQRPLFAYFRNGGGAYWQHLRAGFSDLFDGLVNGARNMVAVAIATATAGIIVGTVTLTGIGLAMTELVEILSGGNIMLMLLLVAAISLVLGMGLPTTANYIVVATLMAPVVVELGAQSGLLVPLIAVHMFVFYFGLMADVTPPVGLASYAAAGIARSDPIRTGITAFAYSGRTAILPFMFIFNTQLLLIGITSVWHLLLTIFSATLASLMFAAATQGYMLVRNRLYESLLLLLVTFTLFRPGFWMDMIYPPHVEVPISELNRLVEEAPRDGQLRVWVSGMTLEGDEVSKGVLLPLGETAPNASARLANMGLTLMVFGGDVQVAAVGFRSRAERLGLEQGFVLTRIELPSPDRPAKEWMFVPALALLGLIVLNQRRRRQRESSP